MSNGDTWAALKRPKPRELWFIDRNAGGKVVAIVPVDGRMIRPG